MIRSTVVSAFLFLSLCASTAAAGTRFVNAALTTGANDGSTWANAYQGSNGLQAAMAVAVSGDQVWCAAGSYKPTTGATRSIYFPLRNGVEIYGGFAGTEIGLDQRNIALNVTILSADLAGNDGSNIYSDNSFHVIDAAGTNTTAVLDGFTVRGGNATGASGNQDRGGGILCVAGASPTVRNCIFRDNRCNFGGGAGYVNASSPVFQDCRFEANQGGSFGGAFDTATNANTVWQRCVFVTNSAARAGAVEIFGGSNSTLTNCIFYNNTSTGTGGGGAIYINASNPVIRHCIVAGNHATSATAAGISSTAGVVLSNNIVYFNEASGAQGLLNNVFGGSVSWSCVQGITSGTGNIGLDPLFVNFGAGNLHLQPNSPCADAGNNALVPAGTTTDIEGNPRRADDAGVPDTGAGSAPIVDMGAYELPNTLYSFFCAADGSLATSCPCGNNSAPAGGRGCLNSDVFSQGALLSAAGTNNPDTVVLTSSDMLASVSCVFLQGNQQNLNGVVFGDGVRCVAGSLKRLFIKSASGGMASAPGAGDPTISARSAALGDTIAPGSQRYYQVYYRDPDLTFCPTPTGNSWNVSSGVIVNW